MLERVALRLGRLKGPGKVQDFLAATKLRVGIRAAEFATTKMCFVAGTPVHVQQGLVAIEEVRARMMALSRDPQTGVQEYKEVLDTFVTHPERLYHITIRSGLSDGDDGDETLVCTGEHPFYVVGKGAFVEAAKLSEGDELLIADGRGVGVASIRVEDAPEDETFTTYNFEVEEFHTYFVGERGVWVHNEGSPCQRFFKIMKRMRELMKKGGYIAGDGSPADEWMLLQCSLVRVQQAANVQESLLSSIIKKFGDEYFDGGLIDIPSVPYSQAGTIAKYTRGPGLGVQYHHWWPREWLPDGLRNGPNFTDGLTLPLATPVLHTRLPSGLQPRLNRFMRERLGGSLAQAKQLFKGKSFEEQKELLREFYGDLGLRFPDFTSPGLVD